MPTATKRIRRATPADLPRLTQTLARAFHDDPVAVWICRSDLRRTRMLETMYRSRLRQMLAEDEVWTTPELTSAALWTAPGRSVGGLRDSAALAPRLLHPRIALRLPLIAAGLASVRRRHPQGPPHWYLSLLGTDPGARGRGLGSALLEPVLERCDREGACAYLESSKRRNVDFYERHGFGVSDELRLPRGPTMWLMWREPRR